MIIVNSVELVNDVSNEKRFFKSVVGPLQLVRNAIGDGLFTVRPSHSLRVRYSPDA